MKIEGKVNWLSLVNTEHMHLIRLNQLLINGKCLTKQMMLAKDHLMPEYG